MKSATAIFLPLPNPGERHLICLPQLCPCLTVQTEPTRYTQFPSPDLPPFPFSALMTSRKPAAARSSQAPVPAGWLDVAAQRHSLQGKTSRGVAGHAGVPHSWEEMLALAQRTTVQQLRTLLRAAATFPARGRTAGSAAGPRGCAGARAPCAGRFSPSGNLICVAWKETGQGPCSC